MNLRIGPGGNLRMGPGSNMRISPNEVKGNGKTEITKGQISVGGNLNNSGKIKVFDGGKLEIKNDLINSGDILINDPEKIKEIIIEALKAAKSVSDFGKSLIEKLFLK